MHPRAMYPIGIRVPPEESRRIADFAARAGLSKSRALRAAFIAIEDLGPERARALAERLPADLPKGPRPKRRT